MQTTVISHQAMVATAPVVATLSFMRSECSTETSNRHFAKGEQLFHAAKPSGGAYLVISGEIVIVRNGRPVDLVEAGELLEQKLWPNATAIALTAGYMETMERPVRGTQPC